MPAPTFSSQKIKNLKFAIDNKTKIVYNLLCAKC